MSFSVDVQNIIVFAILLAATAMAVYKAYKSLRPKQSSGCGGGCASCPMKEHEHGKGCH